ncbi:uncharacterized protein LOC113208724 isoform X1 [Frankliniella occidentalis]|uniref:Uncharacterized protein LOC113208724 isoform X1 n=1 Tax=Frankliniella occidentalis TaxID=133901 RepID=A0A6J1SK51_FRAOC|nr:uncharacterized protein LOC113208724 isoform X1 [Frankliniella occidentalis]
MKLYLAVALLCVVAATALPHKGGKKGGSCKADADCKKHACTPAGPSSCDRSAHKCVCKKAKPKTTKAPSTPAATTAPEDASPALDAAASPAADDAAAEATPAARAGEDGGEAA